MNKNLIITIGVGVGSAVAGFFGGWFTKKWRVNRAERKLAESYMDLGSIPVAAPRKKEAKAEKKEEAPAEEDAGETERLLLANSIGLDSTEETPEKEASPYKQFKPRMKRPRRIEKFEYDSDDGYEKAVLHYYWDGTLTDEDDRQVDARLVGNELLTWMGGHAEVGEIFVRNDALRTDYKVVQIMEDLEDLDDPGGEEET